MEFMEALQYLALATVEFILYVIDYAAVSAGFDPGSFPLDEIPKGQEPLPLGDQIPLADNLG